MRVIRSIGVCWPVTKGRGRQGVEERSTFVAVRWAEGKASRHWCTGSVVNLDFELDDQWSSAFKVDGYKINLDYLNLWIGYLSKPHFPIIFFAMLRYLFLFVFLAKMRCVAIISRRTGPVQVLEEVSYNKQASMGFAPTQFQQCASSP